MPRPPQVRYGALAGLEPVCRELGLDSRPLLRSHGLDPALLGSPDAWAPAAAVIAVLEAAAAATGCATLGLRMARHRTLTTLGPIGLVLAEEPTLRDSLAVLARFWPSYNEALRLSLVDRGATTSAAIRFEAGSPVVPVQATELAAAVIGQVVAARLGPAPRAMTATFRHAGPTDVQDHEALLGARVVFGAAVDAVELDRADVDWLVPVEDPQRVRYARQYLEAMARPAPEDRADRVRQVVEDLLPVGRCSADRVAASLGVDRRTLHRWLAAEGLTFGGVLERVRRHGAERHLADGVLSLTEIAERVGFVELSSFSRWFAAAYGVPPSAWRATATERG